ncbi:MAG: rRNA maturation RNase YbeY [Prolixibacteraceae bacterium]|nr:rRNA maturation RNase YbeY [Prolixibacteraceae bacterium]
MIAFFSEDIKKPKLRVKPIKEWIKTVILSYNNSCGDINIIFCSDKYLLEMNKAYLNHDYFTDIITFNYNTEDRISGDIFISLDTVKNNSIYFSQPFNNELLRVIIHGILHLLGYDDKTEQEQVLIHTKEDEAIEIFHSKFSFDV